jgi:hypothetical protein
MGGLPCTFPASTYVSELDLIIQCYGGGQVWSIKTTTMHVIKQSPFDAPGKLLKEDQNVLVCQIGPRVSYLFQ